MAGRWLTVVAGASLKLTPFAFDDFLFLPQLFVQIVVAQGTAAIDAQGDCVVTASSRLRLRSVSSHRPIRTSPRRNRPLFRHDDSRVRFGQLDDITHISALQIDSVDLIRKLPNESYPHESNRQQDPCGLMGGTNT